MLRKFASRIIKSSETVITTAFPSGASLYLGNNIALNGLNYSPPTLEYCSVISTSQLFGVTGSYLTYNFLKKKIYDNDILMKEKLLHGMQTGIASSMAGFTLYPSISLFSTYTFVPTFIGTSIVVGSSFYLGLRFSRILVRYKNIIEERTPINQVTDKQYATVMGSSYAWYIATQPNIKYNLLEMYFNSGLYVTYYDNLYISGLVTSYGFLFL